MGRREANRWKGIDISRELLEQAKTRPLTDEEILTLKKCYTGYGGLTSWSNGQFFTPSNIVKFITDFLEIPEGSAILEPSCGAGAFFEYLPDNCHVTGVELSHETAAVARLCHPNAEIIRGNTLEMLNAYENSFDFVIGNPPFEKMNKKDLPEGYDIATRGHGRVEWYFVELAVRALKPGGVAALVLPDGIFSMDSARVLRTWVMEQCYYMGTVSLPNETFYHSGTSVKTSIMFIQKKLPNINPGNYYVYMAICDSIGWDSRGREKGECDLDKILAAYRFEFVSKIKGNLRVPLIDPEVKVITETKKNCTGQLGWDFEQAS